MTKTPIIIAAALAILFAAPAFAKNPHAGEKKSMVEKQTTGDEAVSNIIKDVTSLLIGDKDRETIRHYLKGHNPHKCPPGLAKKHNGCLPPGQAKKYDIGKRLPKDSDLNDLPKDLLSQLKSIAGYRYGKVGDDVVLISEATQKVVDAVSLLSALQ